MGKNRVIKSLGNLIGNIVVHKILINYTNKPESISHLKKEVVTYGNDTLEIANEFNWNEKDKEEVMEKALKRFNRSMKNYYGDVDYDKNEAERLVEETIGELIL